MLSLTNAPNGAPEELIVDLAARGDDGGTADDVRIVDDNDMEITQVTIAAGATRATFFVQAVDDDDLEYAETVNIYASAINSKAITDSGYDLAVLSDEGLLSGITVQGGTEGETVQVQIRLSHSLPDQVPTGALSLVLLDGTTMNADVKILPRDIVADLKASKTTEVTIELTDDLLVENAEEFTVTLRIDSTLMPDLTALFELTPSPSSFTITDNDLVTATLSRATLELSEGQTGIVEIRLTDDAPEDLTFTLELDGVSGDLTDSDYTLTPIVALIPAGADRAMVSIFAVDDSDTEAVESFTLRLESVSTRVTIDTSQVITVTIPENDQPTTPALPSAVTATLSLPTLSVPEGEAMTFEIRLTDNAPADLTFTLVGDSAYTGDYTLSPDPIVISKGSDSVIVTITAVDDVAAELDEVFMLSLMSDPSSSLVIIDAPSSITVTIPENDQTTPPALPSAVTATLSLPTLSVPEGEAMTFEIRLTDNAPADLTFTLVGDSAYTGDYTLSPDPIVISKGSDSVIVTITAVDDVAAELDEVFMLSLMSDPSSSLVIIDAPSSITVTIPANDQTTPPALPSAVTASLSRVSIMVPEGESRTFEILLTDIAPQDLTFTLVGGPVGEYSLSPDPIVISKGATSVIVTVMALEDVDAESDEVFTLSLMSDPSSSLVIIDAPSSITVTIPENDQPPAMPVLPSAVTATLSLPTLSVPEGEARTFEIRLTDNAPEDLTFTLVGGPSGEYSLSPDPIVISKGSDNVIVTVTAVDDTDPESDEVFTLSLMSDPSSSLVIIDAPSSITVTIIDDDEATAVEFVVTSATINEGDEYEIELRLVDSMGNASSYSQDIVVTLAVNTNSDTNLSEGEYLLDGEQRFSTMVTIPANESTGTVLFQSLGDNIDELDEYITLRISAADQVSWQSGRTLRINVRDDYERMRDVTATLIVSTLNIREDEKQTLLVKLSEAPASTVTVKLTPVSGSAGADDYSLNPRVLTFTPTSSLELSVLISGVLDSLYEGPEDVVFELSVLSGRAVTGAIDRVAVTIADSDPVPSLSLELSSPSVNEGDEVTVSAVLNGKRADALDVLLEIVGGTATLADYSTPTTLRATIPAMATRVAFVITAAADSIYDGVDPETLELRLSVPDSAVTTAPQTLTITDIDDLPTLTLDVPMEIGEGVGALALTATLSGALDQDVELTLSVGGEASRDDYRLMTPTLTILAGERTAMFELVIMDDKVYEATETLELTLSGETAENEAFVPAVVTRMITDNDPRATIRILPITPVTEGDSLTITVVLTAASNDPVTVTLLDTRNGDARQTADYALPAQLVETIAPNELTATFTITTADDDFYEGAERIVLRISTNKGDVVESTARINDEDTAPTVRFAASQPTTVNEGVPVEISVELDGARLEYDLTVEFEVTMASTATPAEYTLSTNVVITAGTDSATITLTADNDGLYDGSTPETVVLRLTRASGGLPGINVDTTTTHTVSITDAQTKPTLSLEPVAPSVTEGQEITVRAVLSGALDEDVVVALDIMDGTAGAADYTLLTMLDATIAAGTMTAEFTIMANTDNTYEGDPETLMLTLSTTSSEVINGNLDRTLTIMDADDLPTLSLEGVMNVNEGAGTLTLTARLSVALDVDVEVTLAVGGAVTTADYTLATPMMTIDAGAETATFVLVITDDNTSEGNEIWTLSLSGQTAENEALATIERMLTITDNDGAPTISLDPVATVTEGGNIEIVVNLIGTTTTEIEVTLELLSSGTARENDDYTVPSQLRMTIPVDGTEARFTVVTVDDDLYEGTTPETLAFRVTSSNAGGGPLSGVAMIRDNDDAPTVIFTASSSSVTEGATANVEVSLVGKLSESDVVVTFTVDSTTATGDDYTSPVTSVTIPAGMSTAAIKFAITQDDRHDGDAETVILTLSSASNAVGTIALGATTVHTLTIDDQQDQPTLSLELSAPSVTEGGSVIFTATLTGALDEPVEVLLAVTGGDANPDDYTLPTTLLATIPTGATTVAFVITANTDGIYEGDPETLILTLSTTSSAVMNGNLVRTLMIMDLDTQPTLSLEGVTDISEVAGTLTLTARLDGVLDIPVQITLSAGTGGTATEGIDYTLPSSLEIPAGARVLTFTITINDENVFESDETVELILSASGSDIQTVMVTRMFRILNDDQTPGVDVIVPTSVNEGDPIDVTIRLDSTSSTPTPVTLSIAPGADADSNDYTDPTQLTRIIPANMQEIIFTIITNDDDRYEGDETIEITVSVNGGSVMRTVTITDAETAPTVSFDVATSTSNEGTTANVLVKLDGDLHESDVVVSFTVGGTATPGTDYTSPVTLVTGVTIAAGTSSAMIVFDIEDDQRYDGVAETVELTLISATGDVTVDPTNDEHEITITDAETAPTVVFNTDLSTVAEGGFANVLVELDGDLHESDVVVSFTVGGTAVVGDDYTSPVTSVTIPAGMPTAAITFAITSDSRYDGAAETVVLTLDSATGDVTVDTPSVHTVTITDNETAPTVLFDVATSTSAEGTTANVLVELDGDLHESDVVVSFTVGGTAVAGDDYTSPVTSVTIPAGMPTAAITFAITSDSRYDGSAETVILTLTSATGDVTVGATSVHTVTITDAETAPTVSFDVAISTSDEGTTANVLVELDGDLHESDVVVSFTVGGTAVAGNDYTSPLTSVTIPAGESTATITFAIEDDKRYDGAAETVVLTLTSATGDVTVGATSVHTVTITDAETAPTVLFDVATSTSDEGTTANVVVELDGDLHESDVVVSFTVGGTAVAGDDYTSPVPMDSVTIPAGERSAMITFAIEDDKRYDGAAETVVLTLTSATGDVTVGATSVHTVTITDAETAPTVLFDVATSTSDEGTTANVVVELDGDLHESDVVVSFTVGGTAVAGDDYTSPVPMDSVTIPAGERSAMITFNIDADQRYDGAAETVILTLTSATGDVTVGATSVHTVTITDNETAPTVSFEVAISTSAEGTTANVEVELDGDLHESDVVVSFTIGGTAVAGDDYTSLANSVTILAGDRSAMITFNIEDDQRYDGAAETVVLTLTSATGGVTVGATDEHTVTITDADSAPSISLSSTLLEITEGAGISVAVTLSGEADVDITIEVDLSISSGNLTEDGEYLLSPAIITIPAGQTGITISLFTLDDNRYELTETIVLEPSATVEGVELSTTPLTIRVVDNERVVPTVSLVTTVLTIDEGYSGVLTATLDVPLDVPLTISLGVASLGTAENNDFTLPDPITLAPGMMTATFTIEAFTTMVGKTDDLYEGNEIFELELVVTPGSVPVLTGAPTAAITIKEGDALPSISLEPAATVREGNDLVIRATLDRLFENYEVSVSLSRDSSSTASTADYTLSQFPATIPAGSRVVEFTLSTSGSSDDNFYEGDETLTLVLSASGGGVMLGNSQQTITIVDDESRPTLVIDGVEFLDEGKSAIITVRLDGDPLANDITVSLDKDDDSSTLDANDYELVTLEDVILAGNTTAAFRLTAKVTLTADMQDMTEIDEMLALIARVTDFEDSAPYVVTIPGIAAEIVRRDDTFDACKLAPSGVEACVDGDEGTYNEPLLLIIGKAAPDFVPVELPPETTYLKIDLLWDIHFVEEAGQQDEVPSLDRRVRVQFTAPRDVVDANGGPNAIAVAVLHGGEQEWEVLETDYIFESSTGKYRFYAYTTRFSHFTLIVQPETEDEFGLLPPTGGLALPLWLVLTLLLTGLALVVGTVYVVRRRPRSSSPRI